MCHNCITHNENNRNSWKKSLLQFCYDSLKIYTIKSQWNYWSQAIKHHFIISLTRAQTLKEDHQIIYTQTFYTSTSTNIVE
jgi:hypothetical protein